MAITNSQGKLILTEGSTNYRFDVVGNTLNTTGLATNQLVTTNLVSWWRLEENTNSADGILDHAYTSLGVGANPGNHGTKFGTAGVSSGPTNGGNALDFSGDDYVEVSTPPTSLNFPTEYTFSFWLKDMTWTFPVNFFFAGGSNNTGTSRIYSYVSNSSLDIYWSHNNVTNLTIPGGSYTSSNWNNFTITWSGPNTRLRFYLNGSLSVFDNAASAVNDQDTAYTIIGAFIGYALPYIGKIDEVLAYNRELTAGEVLQNYNYYQ